MPDVRGGLTFVVVACAACAAEPPPELPKLTAPSTASSEQTPTASPPPPALDVVRARVLQSGPIGSGRCAQCSHQVVVESKVSGTMIPSADPVWIHFEHCEGEPPPKVRPDDVGPCVLASGTTYEFTLDLGGKKDFGGAPSIVRVRK